VTLYVQVRHLSESLERVTDLGGAVLTQPFDVPNGPSITVVEDPEGSSLVLVQQ
jgi:predicted enzyme related to lactoylglutathione lyase